MTDPALEERMARLAARRAGQSSAPAPPPEEKGDAPHPSARRRTRAAATARVVATGASLGGSLGLVAAMALGDGPAPSVPSAAAASPVQSAPRPPVVRIVYRPVPVAAAVPSPAAAPAQTAPPRRAPVGRPAASAPAPAPTRRPAATTSGAS